MTKAFVDTTVLTDAALKSGPQAIAARTALASYSETLLPVYAIKEFKRGPLSAYRWLHNKFASQGSYAETVGAVQAVSRTPQRYRVSTALEALTPLSREIGTLDDLNARYDSNKTIDELLAHEARVKLKKKILRAWAKRRKLTTSVVNPLSCYQETEPREERGQLVLSPTDCIVGHCCMRPDFAGDVRKIEAMRDVLANAPDQLSREQTKRLRVLKDIARVPKRDISRDACRALGDAVFAFYAPTDATILTTNVRDHEPLARAVGVTVTRP